MKALITGCVSFIGSHLTERLLAEDYEVAGIECFRNYYAREIKEINLAPALGHRKEESYLKKRCFPFGLF